MLRKRLAKPRSPHRSTQNIELESIGVSSAPGKTNFKQLRPEFFAKIEQFLPGRNFRLHLGANLRNVFSGNAIRDFKPSEPSTFLVFPKLAEKSLINRLKQGVEQLPGRLTNTLAKRRL